MKRELAKHLHLANIPSGWDIDFVENLASISTGGRDTQDRVEGGSYPFFVRSQNIEQIDTYCHDGVAVLTAGDGVGTGKVFHFIDGKFDCHQRVYMITDFSSRIDPRFFFQYFRANFLRQVVRYTAKTSVDSVRMEMIAKMPVPIPPLTEQQRIAKILHTWDHATEIVEELVDNSQREKHALMQRLLTACVRLPSFSEEWKLRPLGQLTKIYDGTHSTPKYTDDGVPFYSVEHLTRNDFSSTKFISEDVFEKENRRVELERDDILMTRIGDIGTARLIDWDVRASFYVSLALIKASKYFDSAYMANYISSTEFQRELYKRTIHVAFPKKINLGEIGECIVALPSIEEQRAIARVLQTVHNKAELHRQNLNLLKAEKKALMQQLLTGKRRVCVDKAVESAYA